MNHRTETLESIRDQLGQMRDELADLIELERHQSTTTEGKDE
jgi:hypothetical protein